MSLTLNFISIFVHISGSIEVITLIWVSWKDCFLQQKLSKGDANIILIKGDDRYRTKAKAHCG